MLTSLVSSSSHRTTPRAHVAASDVQKFVEEVVSEDMHALRVTSLTNGVLGVLHCAALGIHAIGRALAAARGLDVKHAVKQVDRLLSNRGVDVWQWFSHWVAFVVAARDKIVVAIDWTHFEPDDQANDALGPPSSQAINSCPGWMWTLSSSRLTVRNDACQHAPMAHRETKRQR